MSNEYYIDEILHEDEKGESLDVGVGYISKNNHGRCIRVYGNRHELTERIIKIINGLNN